MSRGMVRYDADTAECEIFTFKEGLLSKIAHDLRLRVAGFQIAIGDSNAIDATFEVTSIQVVCARKDGEDDPSLLSDSDKRKISNNVQKDVLETRRHPTARFRSTTVSEEGEGFRIHGELTLHGTSRPISTLARRQGDRWVVDLQLHQPDYGIKPYSAMMGALKVQPDVRIKVSVPAS